MDPRDRNSEDFESDNFSQSMSSYSSSLDKSADSLREAAKSYDKSVQDQKKMLDSTVVRLEAVLKNFAKTFDKDMETQGEEQDRGQEEYIKKLINAYDKDNKNKEGQLKKSQIWSKAFIDSLKTFGSMFISKITDAFKRVVDNYNKNFTDITSRMQWSASQYTSAMKEVTDRIQGDKLTKQFSQIDWTDSLGKAMSVGLRGQLAQDAAYQNMITTKLLPMLTTTNRSYTRMTKNLGDSFGKAVAAIGTYTEEMYGAEGLEEGGLDNVIETLGREIETAVRNRGGSEEEAKQLMAAAVQMYNQTASNVNADAAEKMLSDLKDALVSPDANGNIFALNVASKVGIAGKGADALTPEVLGKYMTAYAEEAVLAAGNTSMQGAALANSAGYGDYNTLQDFANAQYFNKGRAWEEDLLKGYDPNVQYTKEQTKLQEGYYQSITDQAEKWNENVVADVADIAAETLPYTNDLLGNIWGTIKGFFGAWLASKAIDGANSAVNKNGGWSNLLTKFQSSGVSQKLTQTGMAAGYGKGGLGSTLGGALKTAGPWAAAAWSLADGIGGGVKEYEKSGDFGKALGMGALSSVTGVKDTPESVWGIVGNVAKNSAKGALAGSAGGPWGALIGAAAGGAAALADSLIRYNSEEAKHERLVKKNTETLQKNAKVLEETTTKVELAASAETALDTVQNKSLKGTSQYADAVGALKDLYPDLLKNMSEDNTLTDTQVKLLKDKVEYSQIVAAQETKDALEDYNAEDLVKGIKGDLENNERVMRQSKYLEAANAEIENLRQLVEDEYGGLASDEYGNLGYYTEEDTVDEFGNHIKKSVFNKLDYDEIMKKDIKDRSAIEKSYVKATQNTMTGKGLSTITDAEYALQEPALSGDGFDLNVGEIKSEGVQNFEEAISQMIQAIENSTNYEKGSAGYLTARGSLELALTKLQEIKDLAGKEAWYPDEIKSLGLDQGLKLPDGGTYHAQDLADMFGISGTFNSFKVGLPTVPYDDYPALLHQGESVLTADTASKLRQLSKRSVSGFIDDLTSLSGATGTKTTAVPAVEDDNLFLSIQEKITNIETMIRDKFESSKEESSSSEDTSNGRLVELLSSILEVLSGQIVPPLNKTPGVPISEQLIRFKGV